MSKFRTATEFLRWYGSRHETLQALCIWVLLWVAVLIGAVLWVLGFRLPEDRDLDKSVKLP